MRGKASLWDLFELDLDNGGHGWTCDLGKVLGLLDSKTLYKVREWIDDQREDPASRNGTYPRSEEVRLLVGLSAWAKAMPSVPLFADAPDDLPFQIAAIRDDGRKCEIPLPIRAALLQQSRRFPRERIRAKLLGMTRSSYKRMEDRMKRIEFSLHEFTGDDLSESVLPKKTDPKAKLEE